MPHTVLFIASHNEFHLIQVLILHETMPFRQNRRTSQNKHRVDQLLYMSYVSAVDSTQSKHSCIHGSTDTQICPMTFSHIVYICIQCSFNFYFVLVYILLYVSAICILMLSYLCYKIASPYLSSSSSSSSSPHHHHCA